MKQALVRFEDYLKRQFNQSSTAKHYLSDLRIFVDTIGCKLPRQITSKAVTIRVTKTTVIRCGQNVGIVLSTQLCVHAEPFRLCRPLQLGYLFCDSVEILLGEVCVFRIGR